MAIDPICGMQVDEDHLPPCRSRWNDLLLLFRPLPAEVPREEVAQPATRTGQKPFVCRCVLRSSAMRPVPVRNAANGLEPATPARDEAMNDELRDMTRRFWSPSCSGTAGFTSLPAPHACPPSRMRPAWMTGAVAWMQCGSPPSSSGGPGLSLLARGWRSFRTLQTEHVSLIALGVIAAYGYSLVAMRLPRLSEREGPRTSTSRRLPPSPPWSLLRARLLELRAPAPETGDARIRGSLAARAGNGPTR